ncbi:MAG: hypothetical protein HC819_21250 [Cyclobacteriaceae bacterium]|nr:hypothetical protein [Cyclobacteriaceae bacterium]
MKRRNFINSSMVGLAGALTVPALAVGQSPKPENGKFLYGFDTGSNILDQAKKNIPKVRQREAVIQLFGKNGTPLSNTDVQVQQRSHQFLFGDNNWAMSAMVRNGMSNSDRLTYYRKRFAEVLNALNATVYWTERPRNDAAKTQDFQGEVQWDDFDESVNWALTQGLVAKGHPMFWPVPKAIPEWLARYPYETQLKFVEVRIRNLAARYQGRVKMWDAVNEMLWEPHPKNLSLRTWPYVEQMDNMVDYIYKIITWAREEDPQALYALNDYGLSMTNIENLKAQNGDIVTAKTQRSRYIELVKRLGDAGAPPNLMGLQCHTGWLSPGEQMAFYDEMATSGIPLSVTEFWANVNELKKLPREKIESEEWRALGNVDKFKDMNEDEMNEIRDQYVLDYMTCAFAHPSVDSFYFWGFMNMALSWKNDHDSSHEVLPVFEKVKKLIHSEWNTSLMLKTDEQGRIKFKGFCGNYTLKIEPPNQGAAIGHAFAIDKQELVNTFSIRTIL